MEQKRKVGFYFLGFQFQVCGGANQKVLCSTPPIVSNSANIRNSLSDIRTSLSIENSLNPALTQISCFQCQIKIK